MFDQKSYGVEQYSQNPLAYSEAFYYVGLYYKGKQKKKTKLKIYKL